MNGYDVPPPRIRALSRLEELASTASAQMILRLLSHMYCLGVTAWDLAYTRQWRPAEAAPVPVIAVGGLEAGGTGKTPVTRLLTELLAVHRPMVILRGYGGRKGGGLPYLLKGDEAAVEVGDEALLHKRWNPEAHVVIAGDRVSAAKSFGSKAGIILLDDGFQHRSLKRNLNILVAAAEHPSSLLPLGRSREPLSALRRADLLWVHDCESTSVPEWWTPHFSGPVVRSQFVLQGCKPIGFGDSSARFTADRRKRVHDSLDYIKVNNDVFDINILKNINILALSCIARGGRLTATLRARGLSVVHSLMLPDHFRPTERELRWIESVALSRGAEGIVITEKDSVHLSALLRHWALPWWIVVGTVVVQDQRLLREKISEILNS